MSTILVSLRVAVHVKSSLEKRLRCRMTIGQSNWTSACHCETVRPRCKLPEECFFALVISARERKSVWSVKWPKAVECDGLLLNNQQLLWSSVCVCWQRYPIAFRSPGPLRVIFCVLYSAVTCRFVFRVRARSVMHWLVDSAFFLLKTCVLLVVALQNGLTIAHIRSRDACSCCVLIATAEDSSALLCTASTSEILIVFSYPSNQCYAFSSCQQQFILPHRLQVSVIDSLACAASDACPDHFQSLATTVAGPHSRQSMKTASRTHAEKLISGLYS